MTLRLTEAVIRDKVKGAARKQFSDQEAPGLRLRTTGRDDIAVWSLVCRDKGGRVRRFSLGSWPQMKISAAREAARTLKAKVQREGADPVEDKRQRRAWGIEAREGAGTLDSMLTLYATKGPGKKVKYWNEGHTAGQRIRAVFKRHLNEPVQSLTLKGLQATVAGHGGAIAAAAAVRSLRPVLKWAADLHDAPRELANLKTLATPGRRDRVVSSEELARIVPVLRARGDASGRAALFMLLTLARRGEVEGAVWADVDLQAGTWTIPKARAKNKQEHVVPLSRQAATLLGAAGDRQALLFPAQGGARLTNWGRVLPQIHRDSKTTGWHFHDLRRTGATLLGEHGIEPHVIEAALNHASIKSPLAATYNRSRYRPAVKAALQWLADEIDNLAGAPLFTFALDSCN